VFFLTKNFEVNLKLNNFGVTVKLFLLTQKIKKITYI